MDISNVTKPSSPVINDRLVCFVVRFDIAARHLATTSSADWPVTLNRSAAASLKCSAVSSGISREATADVLAAAFKTDAVEGGPESSNWNP